MNQVTCEQCRKRLTCKTPCAFVEAILREDNAPLFERIDHKNNLTILYSSKKKEVRESTLKIDDSKMGQARIDRIFSTENESAFHVFRPKLKQTTVFVYRLFWQYSNEQIAEICNSDADTVSKLYNKAKERIKKALELCDQHQSIIDKAKYSLECSERASGKLPVYVKWFLMNKVLGLPIVEIAKMDGTTPATVSAKVRYCYDRIVTGNLTFLDPTPDEVAAAQARIDAKRQRDVRRQQAKQPSQAAA